MSNPIACGSGGYHGQSLERVLQGLAEAGFHYVELMATVSTHPRIGPDLFAGAGLARLQSMLTTHGLAVVSVSGHADLTQPAGVEAFKARIDFAARLGVDIVNTGAGHSETPEAAEQFFTLMRDEVLPYAADRRVRVALETHGGLTGTAPDCLRTLERLDSEWVGINYDPANVLYYRGVRPETDLDQIVSRVIHLHLKDQRGGQGSLDFPPLGEGTVDFPALLRTLAQEGYAGPYSAEIEIKGLDGPEADDQVRLQSRRYMEGLIGS